MSSWLSTSKDEFPALRCETCQCIESKERCFASYGPSVQGNLSVTQEYLVLVQMFYGTNLFFLWGGSMRLMLRPCLTDCLTKVSTQSACRRRSRKIGNGGLKNWVVVRRRRRKPGEERRWSSSRTERCVMASDQSGGLIFGCGEPLTGSSWTSLCTGRELDGRESRRGGSARRHAVKLGEQTEFFVSGELLFTLWGHKSFREATAKDGWNCLWDGENGAWTADFRTIEK